MRHEVLAQATPLFYLVDKSMFVFYTDFMCSVAGAKNPDDVARMLQVMKHRSPDGINQIYDGKFCVGMGRLSIIDLVSSNLFPYKEDNLVLSFNGEIFNYVELREELKKRGHVFRTNSDTEVLLKCWKEWNTNCLQKLNGMFAFAIYDGTTITLARDIAGEKPLYFRRKNFTFASEAKALQWDCEELPPAHIATFNTDTKEFVLRRYWTFHKIEIPHTDGEAETMLEKLLEDAVRIRTRSDVPYALYYSGGIDSSLISTFHNFKKQLTYKDADYQNQFLQDFEKIVWHLDYPVKSFSAFALWQLAKEARQNGIRVVISGEGADELFGGYVRYVQPHFNHRAQQLYPSYTHMFQPARDVHTSGWEEFNGNMQELLRMGDRMASAWGIENRCPFLDKRIIEFAFSLPHHLKIHGLDTKIILNRILKKRMPDYKDIEKAGLYVSVNAWLGVPQERYGKATYVKKQENIFRKVLLQEQIIKEQ